MEDGLHPLPPLRPGRRFTRALQQIQDRADAAGDIDWLVQIESTIVRAHRHAAATGRKGGTTGRTNRTITPSVHPEAD
ncbi:hypothetical protein ACIRG4_35255 [Streptomyces sp. NPDC102395]|uniref:hypothetical protein n=1 Tax=Streptomyces sp. NPDC102395 TaxID=3366168 RepID=UPI00381F67DF